MKQLTSTEEYEEFIDEVVRNRNEHEPSDEYTVAHNVIIDFIPVEGDDEVAPTTVGTPYYDTTVTPMSVILHSERDLNTILIGGIREGAVKTLAADLKAHSDWHTKS